MSVRRRLLFWGLLWLVGAPLRALAQTPPAPAELSRLSIEDLMNIEITSASRKEQRAADVAAAVFVITQDDIHRSGLKTIPDLLRLAPGVDVAEISPSKWAVSVRGFNSGFANKLLVLVDGRSVYNRNFSGVLWETQHLLLEDIDRIEVIRGPGAASWGANAVNGVINILTKDSAETQGGFVRVDGGNDGTDAAVRYGGTVGTQHYRLYGRWSGIDQSQIAPETPANDASRDLSAGFRTDGTAPSGRLMLQGSLTTNRARAIWQNFDPATSVSVPFANYPADSTTGHVLGRWIHTAPSGSSLQVQGFVDVSVFHQVIADYSLHNVNVDTQYHTAIGRHHDLVAGLAYWYIGDNYKGKSGFSLSPAVDRASLATGFVQDEIALFDNRVSVMLGSQVQYDSETGAGLQPTARLMWKASPIQRVWAATSHAIRTGSRYERGIVAALPPMPTAAGLPVLTTVLGNPDFKAESLRDVEAGYRLEIGPAASVDVTAYSGHYDSLRTSESSTPVVQFVPTPAIVVTSQFANLLQSDTRGVEVSGHWAPFSAWRLDGSYSAFHVTPHLAPGSSDPSGAIDDGSVPSAQWQIRSAVSVGPRTTLNLAVFRVGRLEQAQVEGYTRTDVTAERRVGAHLSLMAIGQNLFDQTHTEFNGTNELLFATQVRRSASLRVRCTF
jgi:iron complex outermembrane receptor protein